MTLSFTEVNNVWETKNDESFKKNSLFSNNSAEMIFSRKLTLPKYNEWRNMGHPVFKIMFEKSLLDDILLYLCMIM